MNLQAQSAHSQDEIVQLAKKTKNIQQLSQNKLHDLNEYLHSLYLLKESLNEESQKIILTHIALYFEDDDFPIIPSETINQILQHILSEIDPSHFEITIRFSFLLSNISIKYSESILDICELNFFSSLINLLSSEHYFQNNAFVNNLIHLEVNLINYNTNIGLLIFPYIITILQTPTNYQNFLIASSFVYLKKIIPVENPEVTFIIDNNLDSFQNWIMNDNQLILEAFTDFYLEVINLSSIYHHINIETSLINLSLQSTNPNLIICRLKIISCLIENHILHPSNIDLDLFFNLFSMNSDLVDLGLLSCLSTILESIQFYNLSILSFPVMCSSLMYSIFKSLTDKQYQIKYEAAKCFFLFSTLLENSAFLMWIENDLTLTYLNYLNHINEHEINGLIRTFIVILQRFENLRISYNEFTNKIDEIFSQNPLEEMADPYFLSIFYDLIAK